MFRKIFQGEMIFRTLPTTLLQIFCKIIPNFKDIVKSIVDPDDDCWRNSSRHHHPGIIRGIGNGGV